MYRHRPEGIFQICRPDSGTPPPLRMLLQRKVKRPIHSYRPFFRHCIICMAFFRKGGGLVLVLLFFFSLRGAELEGLMFRCSLFECFHLLSRRFWKGKRVFEKHLASRKRCDFESAETLRFLVRAPKNRCNFLATAKLEI